LAQVKRERLAVAGAVVRLGEERDRLELRVDAEESFVDERRRQIERVLQDRIQERRLGRGEHEGTALLTGRRLAAVHDLRRCIRLVLAVVGGAAATRRQTDAEEGPLHARILTAFRARSTVAPCARHGSREWSS